MTLGGTDGGAAPPAHQFAELGLAPSFTLTQDSNIRADDHSLGLGDLVGARATSGYHLTACQITL